jgi:hypothetical protein
MELLPLAAIILTSRLPISIVDPGESIRASEAANSRRNNRLQVPAIMLAATMQLLLNREEVLRLRTPSVPLRDPTLQSMEVHLPKCQPAVDLLFLNPRTVVKSTHNSSSKRLLLSLPSHLQLDPFALEVSKNSASRLSIEESGGVMIMVCVRDVVYRLFLLQQVHLH